MKNKLKFLVNMSLKRKIKTKWFLIANIILLIGIVGVINIDNIINLFGGDFDSKTKIYIVDNANAYDLFEEISKKTFLTDEDYELIKADPSITSNLENEESSVVLIFNESDNIIDVEMISNEYIDTIEMNYIKTSLNSVKTSLAIIKHNISVDQINDLTGEVNIKRTILNDSKSSDEENMSMIMTTLFPIVIMPVYMLIIYLVQMVGAEINDEKTTRGMEIIIANVSPKVHFFSKCIAGNLFVLLQAGLLILYLILGFVLRGAIGSDVGFIGEITSQFKLPLNFIASLKYIVPFVLILTILNFIAYSLLAGILASVTTNSEDFQQLQTPIIILSFIGYYLAITATTFDGSFFIKLLGYMPFISGILSPSLLLIGDYTVFNVLIAILIMIIVIYLLIKYGLRIYKVGILNYSSGNLWKKMLGAIKK